MKQLGAGVFNSAVINHQINRSSIDHQNHSPCEGAHDAAADQNSVDKEVPHQTTRFVLALVVVHQLVSAGDRTHQISHRRSHQKVKICLWSSRVLYIYSISNEAQQGCGTQAPRRRPTLAHLQYIHIPPQKAAPNSVMRGLISANARLMSRMSSVEPYSTP